MNAKDTHKEHELRSRVQILEKRIEERLGASVDTAQGAIRTASAVRSLATVLGVPPDRWTDPGAWDEALRNRVVYWVEKARTAEANGGIAQAQDHCARLRQETGRLTKSLSDLTSWLEKVHSDVSQQSKQVASLRLDLNALADALGKAEALLDDLEERVAQTEAIARPLAQSVLR